MASLISDKDIERLERVKDILKEIKELDLNFGISNIIEADDNTILIFNMANTIIKQKDLDELSDNLTRKLQCKCIVFDGRMKLDKAIKVGIDYAEGKDYTTESFYEDGQIIKEVTTQYK